MERIVPDEVRELRSLAAHYRALTARAGSSVREERMRTAVLLERETACIESAFMSPTATAQLQFTVIEPDQGPRSSPCLDSSRLTTKRWS